MNVLIFEGIATSGKSTVISGLQKALPHSMVVIAGESKTHIPIMKEVTDKHESFFKSVINRHANQNPDLLIFDRLYLTQAFRTKSSVNDYAEIELLLAKYSPITIFLKVDEAAISDRITKSAEHRGSEYFRSRGKTEKEIAKYYIDQQQYQLKLLKQSALPYKIINTTDHNYKNAVQEILASINEK